MTIGQDQEAADAPELTVEEYVTDELVAAPLAADADERLVGARARASRMRFVALLLAVLLLHVALIAAFLLRDRSADMRVAQVEETPVEVIVEQPKPEPPKPVEPPKPELKPPPPQPEAKKPPPPPEEDLSPALSAPRKPNDETTKTTKNDAKTEAPKAPQPPSEGEKKPTPAAAPPKEEAKAETKEDTAEKPEDKKPDAEALDKAKPKVEKKSRTRQAKAAPKTNRKTMDVLASLSGSSPLDHMSFAKPSAKTKVYGGTEDVRWMSTVEGMLEAKVGQLPRGPHWQAGGYVLIFFHVDPSGRVISRDFFTKSGYPDIDQMAMRALLAAQPFPPPPPGIERGLLWGSKFDGQLPHVTISKR